MTETDLEILEQSQAMLAERLKLLDAEMAHFAGLSGPTRAIETEMWFRKQIAQALAPLIARVEALEKKPMPAAATFKPPQEFIDAVGQFIADELKERDQRIAALESKISNWKYCGVWSEGQYETGNFVTHEGSLFTCLWSTQSKPGTADSWQLCCKRGKDAAGPRQPTAERTYGR
jgi:hypothetical protein